MNAPQARTIPALATLKTTPAGNPRKILGRSIKVDKGILAGVLTAVLYLSPARESGRNLCPWASKGCELACLGHSSGHLRFSQAKQVRVSKSNWFTHHRADFLAQLGSEIDRHIAKAKRTGKRAAIRLNGSSDILWERHIDMASHDCTFYDYTKAPLEHRSMPANYHLTFSVSESPESLPNALQYLEAGRNAAIVVRSKEDVQALVQSGLMGFPCLDGDISDVRFDDPPGHWVVLYAKGAAINDDTGFVWDLDLLRGLERAWA